MLINEILKLITDIYKDLYTTVKKGFQFVNTILCEGKKKHKLKLSSINGKQ